MEPTNTFADALETAKLDLDAKGQLSDKDRETVDYLLRNPVMGRGSERIFAMRRTHWRVRRLYARQNRCRLVGFIDWSLLVGWIVDNWVTIMRVIFSIIPLFLQENRCR